MNINSYIQNNNSVKEVMQQEKQLQKKKEYYKCYSLPQNDYLESEGFKYIDDGYNYEKQKQYWIYKMTDSLSYALTKWTKDNPNKK